MPRKKPDSTRSKREVDKMFEETRKGVLKTLQMINVGLNAGKPLTDEQIRFLKRAPEIINTLVQREKGKDESSQVGLPEGTLKEYVENLWRLQEVYRKATGKEKATLDRGTWEEVVKTAGYYRCKLGCGELHLVGRPCMFQELTERLSQMGHPE